MEDSAYNSIMIGVYVFVFIMAASLTIYLFSTTVSFADKAYEYGKVTTGDSIVETLGAPTYNTVTGAELLTYYYNYKSPDKYGTAKAIKYDFTNIDSIDINKTYTLVYESANSGANPVIRVVQVASEEIIDPGGGVVIDKKPSDPTIIAYPNVDNIITPNTIVEFESQSSVNYSFLTNYISKYYWRIDYSPEDGRADFNVTTTGVSSKLKYTQYTDALNFKSGVNMIYVTAEDALGNKSNTISKRIEVGYKNPVINAIREVNGKVYNNGSINMDSASGVLLSFVGDAVSKNAGGYISTYSWYVNNVLVQSGANKQLNNRFFAPGEQNIKLIVSDSIQGTAEQTFKFTVNKIPAPTITCSDSAVITNKTIAITSTTVNLTFNATLDSKYGIVKYVWNVNGTNYETYVPNGLTLPYGIGTHNITVYGVNSDGIVTNSSTLTFKIIQEVVPYEKEFTYNGSYQSVTLQPGKYLFETWGASGGGIDPDSTTLGSRGGKGGYSKGQITLTKETTFHVFVGGQGYQMYGGFNGGGKPAENVGLSDAFGGGGASDIRLPDTTSEYKTFYDITFANGGLHDDPNATHFHGPYAKLKQGTYQIDIDGNNLDYIEQVWACTNIGAVTFEVKDLVRSNTHISYYVVLPYDKDLMELNVLEYNPATKSNITINKVTASKVEDRIIVAGGGGGADNLGGSVGQADDGSGGNGGGLVGARGYIDGIQSTTQTFLNGFGQYVNCALGGNQNGGSGLKFGYSDLPTLQTDLGGGGGGYYGGIPSLHNNGGGGGGSSFISGYSGCDAVNSIGAHTGQANHYSGLTFTNALMSQGAKSGQGKVRITSVDGPSLIANFSLSNEYFNGSTSYSQPGQLENNFTITFDATPTVTSNIPNQGTYAPYQAGVKTYNYVVTDVHGGYLPVAGMGISVGTNGVAIIAHSDNYYYTMLSYPADLTAKHAYKVVVNNKIPYLYIDGILVKTGVTPVNCGTLIARPSVGLGAYGSYVGYANNLKFYNIAM